MRKSQEELSLKKLFKMKINLFKFFGIRISLEKALDHIEKEAINEAAFRLHKGDDYNKLREELTAISGRLRNIPADKIIMDFYVDYLIKKYKG